MFQFFDEFIRPLMNLLLPNACILCANSVLQDDTPNLCASCVQSFWDPLHVRLSRSTLYFLGEYGGALKPLIVRSKFQACPFASLALAHLMGLRMESVPTRYDLVSFPPTLPHRLRERRFDFMHEVARLVSKRRASVFSPSLFSRTGAPLRQWGLSRTQRLQNLRNSFCSKQDLQGKTVLVMDDVYTTGATVEALSKALFRQGATCVDFAILARTPLWITL